MGPVIDLVRTINDDDDVEDFSEDSDEEEQFQPSKEKKRKTDFDSGFEFVTSIEEYNKNTWDDLHKYVKRKASTKTDDKIAKLRNDKESTNIQEVHDSEDSDAGVQNEKIDYDSDISISSDEYKHDFIKNKEQKKKGAQKLPTDEEVTSIDMSNYDKNLTFYQMNLSRPLLKAIGEMKFTHPTPIQAATIPVALTGKDIYGCAATGTGKTAAYMLPTLERLIYRSAGAPSTKVLVLVPTRELGVQVYQVTKQLCQFTDIQIALAVGGLDLKSQENILRKNPDIVVATPGRLIDHLHGTLGFSLSCIEVLILDEADRMLDEYFAEQMKEIIKQCARTRQTMLFSATMTDEVNDLAAVSLKNPVRVFVDSNKDVAFNLRQEFIRIRSNKEADREPTLAALVCRTFRDHCIIFVQTKKQAHRVHILLGLLGVKVAELHGNLTQVQRLDTLERFKTEQVDVVVATDVAARGLDISGVKTVINFVMPRTLEHYIHRVGRTARAGRVGVSVSLAGEQERKIVKEIIKSARNPVKSRIIPTDILEKYKTRLQSLEPKIEQVLQEEYQERLLSRSENQLNRAQKLLKGEVERERPWFQSSKERKDEKKRLQANKPGKVGKDEKLKTKNKKEGGSSSKDLYDTSKKNAKMLRYKAKANSANNKFNNKRKDSTNKKFNGKTKNSTKKTFKKPKK